jgi:hypothetical protein
MSQFTVTDEEIAVIGPILQRLRWADRATRAKIQAWGVNVLPITLYSNTPSIAEIEMSYEYADGDPPYLNPHIFDHARFEETLEMLRPFASEFAPPCDGDAEQPAGFFWKNDQFSYGDAMAYWCFLRHTRPANVVEIGSGFSTLVALAAVEKNGAGMVHCIEPFPQRFLSEDRRIDLRAVPAQQMTAEELNDLLRDGDVLFIDSTHTVKTGSDCAHLYLRLVPQLRRNVLVHVHDVFLPFGMPKAWLLEKQIFWTEQYLLLAFLLDNARATAIYGSTYNAERHPVLMDALMGGKYPKGGGSFWFRYDGR